MGDISVQIDSITGAGDDLGISIVVKRFKLEPDNYIVRAGDTLNIAGKDIFIRDMFIEKVVLLDVGTTLKERIQEGKSKTFGDIKITNVKVFFKGNKVDNYAIIEMKWT